MSFPQYAFQRTGKGLTRADNEYRDDLADPQYHSTNFQQKGHLEKKLEEKNQQIIELQQEKLQLQDELENLKRKIVVQLQKVNEENTVLQKDNGLLHNEVGELRRRLQGAQVDKQQLAEEVEAIRRKVVSQLQKAAEETGRLQAENEDLRVAAAESASKERTFQQEIVVLREETASFRSKFGDDWKRIQDENTRLRSEIERMGIESEQRITRLVEENRALQSRLQQVITENDSLQRALSISEQNRKEEKRNTESVELDITKRIIVDENGAREPSRLSREEADKPTDKLPRPKGESVREAEQRRDEEYRSLELRNRLQECDIQVKQLHEEKAMLKKKAAEAMTKLQNQLQECQLMEEDLDALRTERNELKLKIQDLESQLKQRQEENLALKKKAAEAAGKTQLQNQEFQFAQEKIDALLSEKAEVQKNLHRETEEKIRQQEENAILKKKLSEVTDKVHVNAEEATRAKLDVDGMRDMVQQLTLELERSQRANKNTENRYVELQSKHQLVLDELLQHKDEIVALTSANSDLQQSNEMLKRAGQLLDEEKKKLLERIRNLQDESDKLTDNVHSSDVKISELNLEIQRLQRSNDHLETKLREADDRVQKESYSVQSMELDVQELRNRNMELQELLERAEARRNKAQQKLEELYKKLEDEGNSKAQAQSLTRDLQHGLDDAEREIKQLSGQLDDANLKNQSLGNRIGQLVEDCQKLQTECETEREGRQQAELDLVRSNQEKERLCHKLRLELEQRSGDLSEVSSKIMAKDREIQEICSERDELQVKFARLSLALEEAEKQKKDLNAKLQQLKLDYESERQEHLLEIERLQVARHSLEVTVLELEKECHRTKHDFECSELETEKLQNELLPLQQELESLKRHQEVNRRSHEDEIRRLQEQIRRLNKDLSQRDLDLEKKEAQIRAYIESEATLRAASEHMKAALEDIRKERHKSQFQKDELEDELHRLRVQQDSLNERCNLSDEQLRLKSAEIARLKRELDKARDGLAELEGLRDRCQLLEDELQRATREAQRPPSVMEEVIIEKQGMTGKADLLRKVFEAHKITGNALKKLNSLKKSEGFEKIRKTPSRYPPEVITSVEDVASDLQLCYQNGIRIIADYFTKEEKMHCGIPSDAYKPLATTKRPIPLEEKVTTTTTIIARPHSPGGTFSGVQSEASPPPSPRHSLSPGQKSAFAAPDRTPARRSVSPPRTAHITELSPAVRKVLQDKFDYTPATYSVQTELRRGSLNSIDGASDHGSL